MSFLPPRVSSLDVRRLPPLTPPTAQGSSGRVTDKEQQRPPTPPPPPQDSCELSPEAQEVVRRS